MTWRALALLRALRQSAFAKLHAGDTGGAAGRLAPFTRVPLAARTGFGLPDTLKDLCPGAGGRGAQAGAKLPLGWDDQSRPGDHFALIPWNLPDHPSSATVGALAQQGAWGRFDLGDCQLAAFVQLAPAHAYVLSRLTPQPTRLEAGAGRWRGVEWARVRQTAPRPLLEQAGFLGARDRGAARLMAARRPAAGVNQRRRRARPVAQNRGSTPAPAHRTLLAGTLFIPNVPGTGWPPETVCTAEPLRGQGALSFKAGKSSLPLSTLPPQTAPPLVLPLWPFAPERAQLRALPGAARAGRGAKTAGPERAHTRAPLAGRGRSVAAEALSVPPCTPSLAPPGRSYRPTVGGQSLPQTPHLSPKPPRESAHPKRLL